MAFKSQAELLDTRSELWGWTPSWCWYVGTFIVGKVFLKVWSLTKGLEGLESGKEDWENKKEKD